VPATVLYNSHQHITSCNNRITIVSYLRPAPSQVVMILQTHAYLINRSDLILQTCIRMHVQIKLDTYTSSTGNRSVQAMHACLLTRVATLCWSISLGRNELIFKNNFFIFFVGHFYCSPEASHMGYATETELMEFFW
jgi:hypothetical protein